MFTVLLVIHVLVTLTLIGVVLIQRSEGGGLGIGGAQGMGSFMTGRGTANLLTRTTAILATVFLALSLVLALMTRNSSGNTSAIFNPPAPVAAPATGLPASGQPASGQPTPGTSKTAPSVPAGTPLTAPGATLKPAAPAKPAVPATP
ncbi:MAG: preprotein translocase subunit SecG [Proteobacteria bacterium]|nr:preprotein translocase subunit SecG [Pseudomonadota bacterium]